jgi:hypothetical protein
VSPGGVTSAQVHEPCPGRSTMLDSTVSTRHRHTERKTKRLTSRTATYPVPSRPYEFGIGTRSPLGRAAEALVQRAGTSLAIRGQIIGVSRHGQGPPHEMETAPRERSRLPPTADRPSVSAPPLREISDAANAAAMSPSAADNDSVVGSLKVSRSDLEQNFSSPALTGFSDRRVTKPVTPAETVRERVTGRLCQAAQAGAGRGAHVSEPVAAAEHSKLVAFHDLDRQLEIDQTRLQEGQRQLVLRVDKWVLSPGWDPTLNSRSGPRPVSREGPRSILWSR